MAKAFPPASIDDSYPLRIASHADGPVMAFDISWSRLHVGRTYASSQMKGDAYGRLSLFTADMSEIPLPDK